MPDVHKQPVFGKRWPLDEILRLHRSCYVLTRLQEHHHWDEKALYEA